MKRAFALLTLSILAFSCASQTELPEVDVEALRHNLKYHHVRLGEFTGDSAVQGAGVAAMTCRAATLEYLQRQGLFHSVDYATSDTAEEDTLLVTANCSDLRIVSGAARFWAGALAGRSHMAVDIQLNDSAGLRSQNSLQGAPNAYGSAWSGGSSDRNLPVSMAKLVGDYIMTEAGTVH
jgi:hypothetical protein